MDESDIQYFLRSIGQYQTKSNAKWVYTNCPLAQWTHPSGHDRSPSFGVSIAPGDTSRFNCFAAETPVLTYDGYYPIAQLVGRASRLLTVGADGISRWVDASVESFGQQVLWRLVLSRNGVRREIRATAGHRWFVNNHGKRCEVITSDLRPGHSLSSVMPPRDDLPQFLKACPSLDIGWVVERVEQTGCVEEVFCAVVPGSACFTLEGHILTGNCFTCHQKGDVRNLLYKLSMYTGRGLDQYNDLARFLQNCNAPALSGTKAKLDRATYKARATEVSGMAVDLPMRAKPLEVVRLDENILDKFEKPSGEVLEYLTGTGEDDLGRRRRGLYHHTVTDWEIGWQDLSQRLALPVRDLQGTLVGVSGRAYHTGQKPKFLHSTGFQRDLYFFGENKVIRGKPGFIVEGHFDAIYLWQMGYKNAVAVMGSSLSICQVEKAIKLFSQVTIVPDGDEAGTIAAEHWYGLLKGRINTRIAVIPDGRDPDENDAEELLEMLGPPPTY